MSKQRIVIVTGGGSGIGQAIANKFADNKDKVFILGRDKNKLVEAAKYSPNLVPLEVDVTVPSAIEAAKKAISKDYKTVDVLVNCAGGNTKIEPDASPEEAMKGWNSIIAVNLTGTFNITYSFLPMIRRPGGRVINISSLAAIAGSSLGGVSGQAYSAAKSGIHGMSRTLMKELAKDGITINCVAPGVIDHTAFFGGTGVPKERMPIYLEKIPLGRLGNPEEIAAGVFYLASEEAGFVTGEILNINGGVEFGR